MIKPVSQKWECVEPQDVSFASICPGSAGARTLTDTLRVVKICCIRPPPPPLKKMFHLLLLGIWSFTVQNDVSAEFSHSSAEGGKILFAHLEFKFQMCTCKQEFVTIQLVWKSIMAQYATLHKCDGETSSAHTWDWLFQSSRSLTFEINNICIFKDYGFFNEEDWADVIWDFLSELFCEKKNIWDTNYY